eukprot:CAMPEP_0202043862 /NCGR_PEP_ID=MMETSP0962-20130828/31418_1 /ASSEMBLY_ACC=CAM_ASM_000488 /TAXON_ID=4773 /ORGANISM="Schizochytrium aggregatum, Strain ATCC28209" /LENGTH=334 /DNA_ID=CAMNT_0048608365 /DNA_START=72 /DNA_END=1076 /DNA_ORIENTATION=-
MSALPALDQLNTPAGMGKLNGFLGARSYVSGFAPSQADVELLKALDGVNVDEKKAGHVARFVNHMNAFSEAERSAWPAAQAEAAAPAEEDDIAFDDDDLFGEETEEDIAARKALDEKMAAEKAARKAGKGKGVEVSGRQQQKQQQQKQPTTATCTMSEEAPKLSEDVEVRTTEEFSSITLKDDQAEFAGKEEAAPAAAEEDDIALDDDDLFGEETEEDIAARKALDEKMAAEKAARKAGKGKGERSLIVLEIKPFDAETDLELIAKNVKTIEHEGIQNWGLEHKFIPIAFGVKKLAISAVVYDDYMDVDKLSELINELHEDDIQSIDVQAMSKV